MIGNVNKGKYVQHKIATIVHSRGQSGQNWVKFGPRTLGCQIDKYTRLFGTKET